MSTAVLSQDVTLSDAPAVSTALARRPVYEVASVDEMRAVMAQKDDEQILAAMAGAMIEEWTYSFKIGGDLVEGISAAGAVEIARLRGEDGFPIRYPVDQLWAEECTQNGEPGIRVRICARDFRTGMDGVGMVFEPYFLTVNVKDKQGKKTGETRRIVNDFADRKALGKARRNAILDLVPETQLKYLLANRKQILAKNTERQRVQSAPDAPTPVRAQPEARRLTAAETAAAQQPHPALERRARPKDATEEQISRLLDLAEDTTPERREKIHATLRRGLQAQVAQTWIEIMERDQGIAHADDGELALDDKQPPPRNAVAEGH